MQSNNYKNKFSTLNTIYLIVTTNAATGMTATAVVMTMEVDAVALHVPVSPATEEAEIGKGVTDGLKKAAGYVTVIEEPMGTAVVGVKPSVTGTDVLNAMRSAWSIVKVTSVT